MVTIQYYIDGEIPDPDVLEQYLSNLIRPKHIMLQDEETIKKAINGLECRNHADKGSVIKVLMMNGVTVTEIDACCDDFEKEIIKAIYRKPLFSNS